MDNREFDEIMSRRLWQDVDMENELLEFNFWFSPFFFLVIPDQKSNSFFDSIILRGGWVCNVMYISYLKNLNYLVGGFFGIPSAPQELQNPMISHRVFVFRNPQKTCFRKDDWKQKTTCCAAAMVLQLLQGNLRMKGSVPTRASGQSRLNSLLL